MRSFLALCLVFLIFPAGVLVEPFVEARADQWYDSYGKLTWAEEKVHLDNFAMTLKRDPNMIGYLASYVGEKDKVSDVQKRSVRAKNYLIHGRTRIDKERIIVVNAGRLEKTTFVLQPVLKTSPPPRF